MPDVVGERLDLALARIEDAGFADEVEVDGGGVFGVVEEENWQVCGQSPSAGEALSGTPQLTVDRSCEQEADEEATPTTDGAESTETTERTGTTRPSPPPSTAPVDDVLTANTSPEFAAILVDGNNCSDAVRSFASANRGRTIEFDGNVASLANHENSETRFDILVSPGDFPSVVGPTFQFRDVGALDLHLTNADSVAEGDNVMVQARIDAYEDASCLFLLDPIATAVR